LHGGSFFSPCQQISLAFLTSPWYLWQKRSTREDWRTCSRDSAFRWTASFWPASTR
jgi:hypothetical protein